MSEVNLGNNPDASAIVPVKRKRGRPRKYPKLDRGVHFHGPRSLNPNHEGSSRVPPGFLGVSENQPRQVDPVNDATHIMVGQTVHGVIEAAFDAGYLLTVRVSNSETTLRGVIFKPGHYIPVSTDNDVAPGVHMIRRNEVPFPRESYAQVHSHNSRSRERNGAFHAARVSNSVASKGKQVPSMAADVFSPANSRGNVVPVLLQPINISNGATGESSSVATEPDHAVPSKGKQEPDDSRPLNGSTTTNQFHFENNNQVTPLSIPGIAGSAQPLQEAEAKSMKLAGMPFEQLLAEVSKRNQVPAQSTETDTSSAGKLSTDDVNDVDQALSVEPLQAVQPDLNNHSAVGSMPLENYRTGKMTELLQKVLQEKINENQAAQPQAATADSRMR